MGQSYSSIFPVEYRHIISVIECNASYENISLFSEYIDLEQTKTRVHKTQNTNCG